MRTADTKKEEILIKAQAQFLGQVHETYHKREQRMILRGCTLVQCRQSLCLLHFNDGMCQILASQSLKRRDVDEG